MKPVKLTAHTGRRCEAGECYGFIRSDVVLSVPWRDSTNTPGGQSDPPVGDGCCRSRSQRCKPRLQSSATDAVVRLRRAGNSQQAHSSYKALPSANLGKQCEPRLAVPEISDTASRSRPNQCNQLVEETTEPSRSTNTLTARTELDDENMLYPGLTVATPQA